MHCNTFSEKRRQTEQEKCWSYTSCSTKRYSLCIFIHIKSTLLLAWQDFNIKLLYDWTPLCIINVWSKFKTFHILWHYKIWVFLFYLTYFHYFIIFIYIFYMNLFLFIYIIKYFILFCCLNITFSIEMYYICYSIYKIWSFFYFIFFIYFILFHDWTPLCIINVWSKIYRFHILLDYKIWVFLF